MGTSPGAGSLTDGAVTSITSSTTILDAVDKVNEALFNVSKNTFVRDVSFVSDVTSGGAGTTVTLTLTVTGNANAFDINWGDGSSNAISNTSVAGGTQGAREPHVYTSGTGTGTNTITLSINSFTN